jgi:sulfonate transport system substrate-binding protein
MRTRLINFAPIALLWLGGVACDRAPAAPRGVRLPPDAPLPTEFAASTTLRLGDPVVQRQLALSGEPALPFVAEWHNVSGGPETLEAFRGAALDAGAVGDTPPIHAVFTGLDVKIIAVNERTTPSMRLAVAPHAAIHELGDLRGKRIAYSPGQAQGALVLRLLRKLQLEPAQVRLIELSSAEFKDALASDQVDAAPLGGVQLLRYLKAYGSKGAHALEHGVRNDLGFLYVRSAVLEDPDQAGALRAYVRARTRAQLWAADHPEEWLKAYFVDDQHLSEVEGRTLLSELSFPSDWRDVIARTQETIDLLAARTGRTSFPAERLFDQRFSSVATDVTLASASVSGSARASLQRDVP